MEELISQLVAKAGISPDQAKSAADVVINFVKTKIPAIGGQLEGILGDGTLPTNLGDVTSKLGNLFGK